MATTEISPVGTRAQGATKVGFFAGALSAAGAISLASDIGHAGFLNLSFYIPGNTFPITGAQNKGTDQRLGSAQVFETLGVKNWSVPDIVYIEDVTGAGSGTPKGLLVENTVGMLIVRFGLPATTDWALAQRAYAIPVKLGMRWVTETSSDEFGYDAYQQVVAVVGTAVEDVAITT